MRPVRTGIPWTGILGGLALLGAVPHSLGSPKSISAASDASARQGDDAADDNDPDAKEFRGKLAEMLKRTEKSAKLLREQISESQSAPFLPELYLQLAELLSQRSNALYYIQQEKLKGGVVNSLKDRLMDPVVAAQKEGIDVYRMLLKDFPNFGKRAQVMYRLTLALKSIDETQEFYRNASTLLKEFPQTEEAMKVRLLLGQHFFERQDYRMALDFYERVAPTAPPYERNLAKYKIGLIHLAQEKYKEALGEFEQVIRDDKLTEQDNPYEISLKSRKRRSDLKREALIDSIRAYTQVFAENPDPLTYYSNIAPTEFHYQETIEKLALRYIFLKRYAYAVNLLRALSERTADPQKILNIYQEVLLMIPVKERIGIPVQEIQFVLERYDEWSNAFSVPRPTLALAQTFFEKQVRDLGTTAHDLAKTEKDTARRTLLLQRASEFYLLYLGFFKQTADSEKMGANLGDVYFLLGEYPRSGEYYLRTFQGEFGKVPPAQKQPLIENAILSLQKKKKEYSFYEVLRNRGMLIKAVKSYMAFDPKKKNDPGTVFLLIKSEYEQGFLPESLDKLYEFIKAFPRTAQARDASELILDYFNTKSDFTAISFWADRIGSVRGLDPAYRKRLTLLAKQSKSRLLEEKIKEAKGYSEFAVGKSYLNAALASADTGFTTLALREALAKSKAERDFRTFFKAAAALAEKEKDLEKRTSIGRSISQEYRKLTRYYESVDASRRIQNDAAYPAKTRVAALEDEINTLLVLRDMQGLSAGVRSELFQSVSPEVKSRIRSQLADRLDSPAPIPSELVRVLMSLGLTDDALLSLYHAQYRIGSSDRGRVAAEVKARCSNESSQAVCRWDRAAALESRREAFLRTVARAQTDLATIEQISQAFMNLLSSYTALEKSGDAQLEILLALRIHTIYRGLGDYLSRAAKAMPDLGPVLVQKAKESYSSGSVYLQRCGLVARSSSQILPSARFCAKGTSAEFSEFLKWPNVSISSPSRSDPGGDRFERLQAAIFIEKGEDEALTSLAREYYSSGYYHHSAAVSSYGLSRQKSSEAEYKAILGCSLLELGLFNEAAFHLKSAKSAGGMRENCTQRLRAVGT